MLFITHDFGVVAEIADRVAVMVGRIVEFRTRPLIMREAASRDTPQDTQRR